MINSAASGNSGFIADAKFNNELNLPSDSTTVFGQLDYYTKLLGKDSSTDNRVGSVTSKILAPDEYEKIWLNLLELDKSDSERARKYANNFLMNNTDSPQSLRQTIADATYVTYISGLSSLLDKFTGNQFDNSQQLTQFNENLDALYTFVERIDEHFEIKPKTQLLTRENIHNDSFAALAASESTSVKHVGEWLFEGPTEITTLLANVATQEPQEAVFIAKKVMQNLPGSPQELETRSTSHSDRAYQARDLSSSLLKIRNLQKNIQDTYGVQANYTDSDYLRDASKFISDAASMDIHDFMKNYHLLAGQLADIRSVDPNKALDYANFLSYELAEKMNLYTGNLQASATKPPTSEILSVADSARTLSDLLSVNYDVREAFSFEEYQELSQLVTNSDLPINTEFDYFTLHRYGEGAILLEVDLEASAEFQAKTLANGQITKTTEREVTEQLQGKQALVISAGHYARENGKTIRSSRAYVNEGKVYDGLTESFTEAVNKNKTALIIRTDGSFGLGNLPDVVTKNTDGSFKPDANIKDIVVGVAPEYEHSKDSNLLVQ